MARQPRADPDQPPIAYRVYLRSPGSFWSGRRSRSIVVVGESALERQLDRKSPIAVWFEPAGRHRCQLCGAEGLWDERWVSWTRYNDRHAARGEGEDVYCSIDCLKAQNPEAQPPSWMSLNDEPQPQAQQRALWRARRRDEDAQGAARKAVRGVPLPDWQGNGWCKWCGRRIDEKGRSSWHKACVREYWLHSALNVQLHFLVERDGRRCAWPGCRDPACRPLEVDHRVPLWKVAHLPPDQRRPYFGPQNLWLLGQPHHKLKTRLEAAERAQARREGRQNARGDPDLFSG